MDKEVNYENQVTFSQKENGVTNLLPNCEIKEDYKNKTKSKIEEKYKNTKNNKDDFLDNNLKNEKMSVKEKSNETFNGINSIVVHLLNGGKFECPVTSKFTGLDVFKKTCDYLILREHEYFGLTYRDGKNFRNWINLEKKILKQIKDNPNSLHFEVKFFPEPTDLKENITRYFLTLQIRNNILNEKILCSSETYALLGSYLVQSELGNYDSEKHGKDYLKDFKFAPNPSLLLIARLAELHKQRKGQTSAEADLAFLQNAKKLSIYGIDFYPAKDSNDSDITIGVCLSGLSVYKNKTIIDKFPWPKIMKISYTSNNFYIKVKPCESEEYENNIGFKLSSPKAAKGLWKITIDHHTFFKSLSGSSSNKSLTKVSSKEDLKAIKNNKHSNLKIQKEEKSINNNENFSKHHRDHSKSKNDVFKTCEKLKQNTSIKTKSKENRNHHHHQIEHNNENHRKRKREEDHHKEHCHHHESENLNKDYKNRSESKKNVLSKTDKSKKYKHKHNCDLGKKLVEDLKSSYKEHKNYDQDKQKYKPEISHQSYHKHHKKKKSKKLSETRLSPTFSENKYKNNFVEDLSSNNVKKSSSHFIRDIINLENDYENDKNLNSIKQITRLESVSHQNILDNSDNYENVINKEIQNSVTYNATKKPGSPPKKDVKLSSKSNIEFDIFWDNEKSQEKFSTEFVQNNSKNLNENTLEEKTKINNVDSGTRFIPRVLLNGNNNVNNQPFLNDKNQQQSKKTTTVGPKTPPDDFDDFCTNEFSNHSPNSPNSPNESQQNKTTESNNSLIESLNANSIKSLSTSQNNSDSESNSNNQQDNKNKIIENYQTNNIKNLNKQDIYDPEAPLGSPDNNLSSSDNDFVQSCSAPSQINNQNFQNNSFNQNGSGDTVVDMEIDSPYSPPQQSSPIQNPNLINNFNVNSLNSHFTAPALKSVLDHLIKAAQLQQINQTSNKSQQATTFAFKKPAPITNLSSKNKILSINKKITLDPEALDEIPSSAVELRIREKYIKKLNRQERVVEELKCSLKPFYQKREINKDEYKEIMRKAVPKICHSKTGEINPLRIKQLVESYINKLKHSRKSSKIKT